LPFNECLVLAYMQADAINVRSRPGQTKHRC
jgi:hypothetical protein